MADVIPNGKWILGIQPIGGTGGGIHQMLHLIMPTALQYMEGAYNITLNINFRMLYGISDPSLGGQMDDTLRGFLFE